MSSRPLAQALALFSVIGLATLVANGAKQDLASALTLHASFDSTPDGDFALGDKRIYTAPTYKTLDAAQVELHTPDVSSPQQNAFLGRWKLTSTAAPPVYVGWLEVSIENGQLTARFSNRGSTPTPVVSVQITNGELVFQPAAGRRGPSPEHRARVQGDRLTGSTTSGDQTIAFVGERPPKWPAADASGTHQFGAPVELFDGTSMDAFDLVRPDQPWFVINGEMTNSPAGVKPAPGSNLRSKQKFQDYRIHAEYKLDDGAHSGIYFRGRYEMQVLGDVGKPPDKFSHMSVYGWVAPLVNASKPDNEWQTMEGTIVADKITVFLNGQKVHDNSTLEAMTTNAVDPNELEPGPIQLVGNDGKIWYRKVTITPIVDTRR